MVAATGHRICNDCMKSCIYQKQEPVNIPQAETRTLKDARKCAMRQVTREPRDPTEPPATAPLPLRAKQGVSDSDFLAVGGGFRTCLQHRSLGFHVGDVAFQPL